MGLDRMAAKKRGRPPKAKEDRKAVNFTFRSRGQMRDLLKAAAAASKRSISEEIEYRLERSFRQQEIEEELKKTLDAQGREIRDELRGEMQKMLEGFRRDYAEIAADPAMAIRAFQRVRGLSAVEAIHALRGLTDEEIAADPVLEAIRSRLAQNTEQPKGESGQPRDLRGSPDDTSEQPDRKEDSK
jgi:aminopeptidase N